jgi:hypothetical protein
VKVADLVVERQAVDRQVGLDEPPVGLGFPLGKTSSEKPRKRASIHGERSGIARAPPSWKTREATICCVQVAPHLGAVAITMSSGRGV